MSLQATEAPRKPTPAELIATLNVSIAKIQAEDAERRLKFLTAEGEGRR